MNQYMELLSPCEKDHVLSMSGDQLKKSALLARALVRTTIARYVSSLAYCFLIMIFLFMKVVFEWRSF